MNNSFLQKSQLQSALNSSLNTSFNVSSMNYSKRGGGGRGSGDGTVLMSNGYTQTLEPFGVPLPAMVRVALNSFTDESKAYSCRLDGNGWGWLVMGRKLYLWRHNQEHGGGRQRSGINCRELLLPPSELLHNAKLVAVLPTALSAAPSCLAVSPEGHITFWPNISNESTTVTLNADIPGQECDSLTSIWPIGCILTTTTSTVLLVKSSSGRGNKPGLSCAPIAIHSGWLGGWSKKMSTMLFTPMPHAPTGLDSKRARVVVPMSKEDDPSYPGNNREGKVYIFQGSVVQSWVFTPDSQTCTSEINIDEQLRRQFLENVWATENDNRRDLRAIQAWIFDIACLPHSKHLAIFAAAKSQYESQENLVYGIVTFDPKNSRQREKWKFIPVVCGVLGGGGGSLVDEDQVYAWKLLATQTHFFVVSCDSILTASDKPELPADTIESGTLGGPIIGCGNVSYNSVVILVPKQGLLMIKPAPLQDGLLGLDETFTEIRVPDHLALSMTMTQHHHSVGGDFGGSEELINRYKQAFILFLQKKVEESGAILENLFPPNHTSLCPQDPLDLATVAFCEKLIDEPPVADPRWGSSFRNDDQDPMGIKSKILIKNFLVDKRESLELFFGFLSQTGLFPRLEGVALKEDVISTGSMLYNSYEKIYFALSLQNMQAEPHFRKVIDTAVKSIVLMRKTKDCQTRSSHLSPNDLFYKEISCVHQILAALVSIQEEELGSLPPSEIPSRILLTNEVILRSLMEVNSLAWSLGEKLSQIHDFVIKPFMSSPTNQLQVLSWVVQGNVLDALTKQQEITVLHGINNLELDIQQKLELLRQLQQLTDIILDGLKNNLLSIEGSSKYPQKLAKFELLRGRLLRTHLDVNDYEGGALLAEKYLDFEVLVTICYDRKDIEGLKSYFTKYESTNFPEFTFEWYVKQGKASELVETFSGCPSLTRFLEKSYPHILWHHCAINEDFEKAAYVLTSLARKEEMYAEDKKFLLCMSKLAGLASGKHEEGGEFVQGVDNGLRILQYQQRIPKDVLNVFGLEREGIRVLSPSEMIDMYTTKEAEFESENFTNALGLAEFMVNEELQVEKRLVIASRAILRDSWDLLSTDHPVDAITNSVLFQFILAALNKGWTLEEVYPLQALFAFSELHNLMKSANARFLLRACHEHITTTLVNATPMED